MPYEIEPEYDLADLSESEVYEQVAQLAAERQLVQGLGILGDNAALNATAADFEVERVRRELDKDRRKQQSLTYRRRRVRFSSNNEEHSPGDVTSDEEGLDLYTQGQEKVVHGKAEELERCLPRRLKLRGGGNGCCKTSTRNDGSRQRQRLAS
ncbi:hypothetical protein BKA61DRAFT_584262 [Leptodontidium sp. MPI-SDFR-AT-0119]|nr:hypothetical protein BKA61DRAFT_584262 [Leptodontidium sp. MPI-SDFR-AT-0119]